jgi:hypothetical protein
MPESGSVASSNVEYCHSRPVRAVQRTAGVIHCAGGRVLHEALFTAGVLPGLCRSKEIRRDPCRGGGRRFGGTVADRAVGAAGRMAGGQVSAQSRHPGRMRHVRRRAGAAFHHADATPMVSVLHAAGNRHRDWEDIGELQDLVAGKAQGRTRPDQITCFNNNTGAGTQFAAVGAAVLKRARQLGLGKELPTERFLENVSP